jgi:hypothetical protein
MLVERILNDTEASTSAKIRENVATGQCPIVVVFVYRRVSCCVISACKSLWSNSQCVCCRGVAVTVVPFHVLSTVFSRVYTIPVGRGVGPRCKVAQLKYY